EVAEKTLRCLYRTVPAAVPGIAFLSGGQSAEVATLHLDLMNKMGPHPWALTFSYGRALQDAALKTWKGDAENIAEAQKMASHRAKLTSAAASGTYEQDMEKAGV
ncbi:MAG: class I fructose-bisphosphate aldolase, partial [Acidimicrobiales bacterium]